MTSVAKLHSPLRPIHEWKLLRCTFPGTLWLMPSWWLTNATVTPLSARTKAIKFMMAWYALAKGLPKSLMGRVW